MCGRYTLSTPGSLIAAYFGLESAPRLATRYNVAPTQEAAVVRQKAAGEKPRLDLLRWGLVPPWAKDPSIGNRMINARSETVAEKPAFRDAFRHRRCLVPADGFYEWKKAGKHKQPYHLRRLDGGLLAIAGLWSWWRPDGDTAPLLTFTLLTRAADPTIAAVHDRMPVLLPRRDHALWLDPDNQDREQLLALCAPQSPSELQAVPVSNRVNSPANDDARCIEPLTATD